MICPYCEKEMKKGNIHARGEVLGWIPISKQKGLFSLRWSLPKGSVKLAEYDIFCGSKVIAYYCEFCKKVIIDV